MSSKEQRAYLLLSEIKGESPLSLIDSNERLAYPMLMKVTTWVKSHLEDGEQVWRSEH
jgi:hypothetical protein